jgi:tetratricopeptide (TPR) repeat protein
MSPAKPPTRLTLRQLWQVPLFFVGLLAALSVWATRPYWYDPEAIQLRRDLARARELLESPHAAVTEAPVLLEDVLRRIARFPARAGETHFLLGSGYLRWADQAATDQALRLRQQARTHLEQAEQLGVSEADQPRLLYRLAKVWYHTGGDPPRVIFYLSQSIEPGADDRSEGYDMLAHAYLRLPVPDVRGALRANEKYLQQPTSDGPKLAAARLLCGELLLRLPEPGRREEARKVLGRIDAQAPPDIRSRARALRVRIAQEEQAWAEAAHLWEEILNDPRDVPREPAPVWYSLGWCYRNLHRPEDAIRVWEQAIQHGGEAGQAAAFRLAELRLASGSLDAALELYQRTLSSVTKPEDYRNTLITVSQVQDLLKSGSQVFQEAGLFAKAQKMADLHARVAPPEAAHLLLGQIAEVWAKAQLELARGTTNWEAARSQIKLAQDHYRDAGAAYEAAAQVTTGPEKADRFWHAMDCYWQAEDFSNVVRVLDRLVKLPLSRERQSEAWYRLGEAHQHLGNDRVAEAAFIRCYSEGVKPFYYRAYYQRAVAEILRSRERWRDATEMLLHNLSLMNDQPDREAHEKTLFTLAGLLYLREEYRQAAHWWEQALTLYPAHANALEARYHLGACYRQLAEVERRNLSVDAPPYYRKQFTWWIEKAAANYQKLVDDLEARQKAASLQESEALLYRQSRFALAECRFDRGQFGEAIKIYDDLANLYKNQVDGLKAVKQLFNAYVQLISLQFPANVAEQTVRIERARNLENAQETVKRARILLEKMDDVALQDQPEPETRAGWERWIKEAEGQLDELKSLLPVNREPQVQTRQREEENGQRQ